MSFMADQDYIMKLIEEYLLPNMLRQQKEVPLMVRVTTLDVRHCLLSVSLLSD